ncbi:hypothetical protein KUV28_10460 [Ferrimonas balearica]|nr:hypothetical protein [Ferrimonas balearica]
MKTFKDGYFALGLTSGLGLSLLVALSWNTVAALIECVGEEECPTSRFSSGAPLNPALLRWVKSMVIAEDTAASWAAVLISFASVVVSAVAVFLVKKTLDATNRTAEASTEATKAMLEANRLQGQAQRPWVTIEWEPKASLELTQDGHLKELKWRFSLQNKGAGIAHNVRLSFIMYQHDPHAIKFPFLGVDESLEKCRKKLSSSTILFPKETPDQDRLSSGSLKAWRLTEDPKSSLYLCASCVYDLDQEGKEQGHEGIALRIDRADDPDDEHAVTLTRHPWYTQRA